MKNTKLSKLSWVISTLSSIVFLAGCAGDSPSKTQSQAGTIQTVAWTYESFNCFPSQACRKETLEFTSNGILKISVGDQSQSIELEPSETEEMKSACAQEELLTLLNAGTNCAAEDASEILQIQYEGATKVIKEVKSCTNSALENLRNYLNALRSKYANF